MGLQPHAGNITNTFTVLIYVYKIWDRSCSLSILLQLDQLKMGSLTGLHVAMTG